MKKIMLFAGAVLLAAGLSAQLWHEEVEEETENTPEAGEILADHFGYWRNQPVKMAYWTVLPGQRVARYFHLYDSNGHIVFTGTPVWIREPSMIEAPAAVDYPGERVYGLDFSRFNRPGTYYLGIHGVANSMLFHIMGAMPPDAGPFLSLQEFERRGGMLLPFKCMPVVDDSFLNAPNPIYHPYPLPPVQTMPE